MKHFCILLFHKCDSNMPTITQFEIYTNIIGIGWPWSKLCINRINIKYTNIKHYLCVVNNSKYKLQFFTKKSYTIIL